jgi:hypothetical protein
MRVPGRVVVVLALCGTLAVSAQVNEPGTLVVSITDAATGMPTPARARLRDAAGRSPMVTGALAVSDSAIPIPTQALSAMWGQQDRAQGFSLQPDGAFYVDGGFDVRLPAGEYTIAVSKGFEYVADAPRVTVGADATTRHEVRLHRWIDMPARGWYSSDDHIHLRRSPADDHVIARWMAAEDVHVGNLLQMGDFWETYFSQYAFGERGRYSEAGRWLVPGQEDPRTPEIGHTLSLGARDYVRNRGDYYSYDRLFDAVHERGGVTGFAHQAMSFHGYRGMALQTVRGKTDFLELAQYCVPEGPLATAHYYLFLDLGIRLTALAGSDFPWCGRGPLHGMPAPAIAQIGNARFYAYVGGTLTYDAWFAALKAGHTFVSTGPIVLLTVEGRLPGESVHVTAGTRVRVVAEAFGHAGQVPLRQLEIVGHGQVVARASGGTPDHMTVSLDLPVERGIWLAARAQAGSTQVAHTTPVYVIVNGTFADTARLRENVATVEGYLREVEQTAAAPAGAALDSQAWRHAAALQKQVAAARAALAEIARTR